MSDPNDYSKEVIEARRRLTEGRFTWSRPNLDPSGLVPPPPPPPLFPAVVGTMGATAAKALAVWRERALRAESEVRALREAVGELLDLVGDDEPPDGDACTCWDIGRCCNCYCGYEARRAAAEAIPT